MTTSRVVDKVRMPSNMARARTRQAKIQRAFDLRLAGKSIRQIAAEMGCSVSLAHGLVQAELERLAKQNAEGGERLRAQQLEQIRVGKAALWPAYCAGDVQAIDRYVRLMDREARLMGLDLKPPDVQVTGPTIIVGGEVFGAPEAIDGEWTEVKTLPAPPATKTPPVDVGVESGGAGPSVPSEGT